MKYVISLLIGVTVGALLFLLGLYYNPFVGQPTISPLAVTNSRVIQLAFSAIPGDGILYTDYGDSIVSPHPDRVAELWEPAIADTSILVTHLQDGRGQAVGLGIKFSSASEKTSVLGGQALANSVWHVYLPGQGTILFDQTENYWAYLRDVVVPARFSSGKKWLGSFHHNMTVGPTSLGTGRVTGGSGLFAGLRSEGVEALTARGYSALSGPVLMNGSLTIALPESLVVEAE
jgi:hypothetical protein